MKTLLLIAFASLPLTGCATEPQPSIIDTTAQPFGDPKEMVDPKQMTDGSSDVIQDMGAIAPGFDAGDFPAAGVTIDVIGHPTPPSPLRPPMQSPEPPNLGFGLLALLILDGIRRGKYPL